MFSALAVLLGDSVPAFRLSCVSEARSEGMPAMAWSTKLVVARTICPRPWRAPPTTQWMR